MFLRSTGIVWTLAGRGVIHEELPADAKREVHGLQIFVNLSSKNKLATPRMFRLEPSEVPEWRNDAGDRVRVLTGSFEGLSSPLAPAEPFDFLDVKLRDNVSFDLKNAHNAVVYVLDGRVMLRSDSREQKLDGEQALAFYGSGGRVKFEADTPSHLVILAGAEIHEPVLVTTLS
jgi:redox-sensitive bicupin YhaK (pirin superfamily)